MRRKRSPSALTDLIRKGDPETLAAVAAQNMDVLLRLARLWGTHSDEAVDVVQETLLVFVRRSGQFDGRASVRTWLCGILKNKLRERRKQVLRDQENEPIDSIMENRFASDGTWIRPVQSPDGITATAQAMEFLNDCMRDLPDRARSAFLLREVDALGTAEICNVLGLSANNLRVILFRARNSLRECLEARGIHGSDDVVM